MANEDQDKIINVEGIEEGKNQKWNHKTDELALVLKWLNNLLEDNIGQHIKEIRDIFVAYPEFQKHIFSSMKFQKDDWLAFVKYYPKLGFVDKKNIRYGSQYYDVLYTAVYRRLLEKYNKSSENAQAIENNVLQKLRGKVLIDLWCGRYECNTSALAYLSNAAAYVGIDVNASLECYNKGMKEYLIEQYKLDPNILTNHHTMIRTIFDNFENFLEKVPTGVWYNFTINGLALTNSMWSIKKHINRIMQPGNIVLANNTENIDIKACLEWPYRYTRLPTWLSSGIHMYEKLAV